MASNDEILATAFSGIPRVAERITGLSEDQKARAFAVVELSYLESALGLDYADSDARTWVGSIMDTLRTEVELQARGKPEDAVSQEASEFTGVSIELLAQALTIAPSDELSGLEDGQPPDADAQV